MAEGDTRTQGRPVKIFFSYSHKDEKLRDKLGEHLTLLKHEGAISEWHDRRIGAGGDWRSEIDENLKSADIILLLVSASFLASEYCYNEELRLAMERHKAKDARVIPVILRPCDWGEAPFGKLNPLPKSAKPVTKWQNKDEAFTDIARGIRQAAKSLNGKPAEDKAASPPADHPIEFTIEAGDVKTFRADVIVLKHARGFYGADEDVADALAASGVSKTRLQPDVGEHVYTETKGGTASPHALFVGVPELWELNYAHIRSLSARALEALAAEEPDARSLAMTVHGVSVGLDEVEAALAQFGGLLDSLRAGQFPLALEKITIVDTDKRRVERLRAAFGQGFKFADYATRVGGGGWAYRLTVIPARGPSKKKEQSREKKAPPRPADNRAAEVAAVIEKAGTKAKDKPHVIVAISSDKEMDDVFSYGIQVAVNDAGYLCERFELEMLTDDILDRLKKRIETAALVIAELTHDDPIVMLQIGYAWGKGRPTLLSVRDEPETPPRFDVRGQGHIKYKTIRSLNSSLARTLNEMKKDGLI